MREGVHSRVSQCATSVNASGPVKLFRLHLMYTKCATRTHASTRKHTHTHELDWRRCDKHSGAAHPKTRRKRVCACVLAVGGGEFCCAETPLGSVAVVWGAVRVAVANVYGFAVLHASVRNHADAGNPRTADVFVCGRAGECVERGGLMAVMAS